MSKLGTLLSGISLGQPQTHGNLTIYPLHRKNGHQRQYRTLDEAMKAGEVVIKEVSEMGSVPALVVQNTGALPILIVVGEALAGAKQNRVLNTSLLVPAQSELQIPVSCIEQGRWAYKSRMMGSSGFAAHASLRRMQTENVTQNLKTRAMYDADQRAVWREVEDKIALHRSSSPTRALDAVYEQTEGSLKEYVDAFTPPEAEGILVSINGKIVGVDLFDHRETLRLQWPKLTRSYALDALEQASDSPRQAPAEALQQFIASAQVAAEESYNSVGLGQDVRLTGDGLTGSGLLWNDQLIHASLFNKSR